MLYDYTKLTKIVCLICTKIHIAGNKAVDLYHKSHVKLEQLHIPSTKGGTVSSAFGTPPMILDSGCSSVSSSTYNSGEEGEYSNGGSGSSNAGNAEDISSGLNPFIFDEHLPFSTSNSHPSLQSSTKTMDQYLSSNSLSSPSSSPPMQLISTTNNNKIKKGEF